MGHDPIDLWQVLALIRRTFGVAVLALAVLYLGDYVALRYRIPKHREPFGSVKVRRYYAVRLKNKRVEYMFDDPKDEVCVRSLFPHLGADPCWYAERHPQRRIDVE